MTPDELEALADRLVQGEDPEGVQVVKRTPVRVAAQVDDVFLKAWMRPTKTPLREWSNLKRARAAGIPAPEPIAAGSHWLATRRIRDARPATRDDLPAILPVVQHMHDAGLWHRDLHLGNLMVGADGRVIVLDLQSSRFLPLLPRGLRERELGFLAYSLGEPLPATLEHVRKQTERRAHQHWRSRTRRCLKQSSGFTPFEHDRQRGFRRSDTDEPQLRRALTQGEEGEVIKLGRAGDVFRCEGLILKRHASVRDAKQSWVAGHGLEVRGVPTGRALAWTGRWLVMEDEGDTLIDWIKADWEKASDGEKRELRDALAFVLARLHARGIYHADLKANNMLWAPGRTLRLVDYGRVRFGRRVRARHLAKNLAQINAALPDAVPNEWREACFGDYLQRSGFDGDAAALRRDVIALSLSRRHRWHGC